MFRFYFLSFFFFLIFFLKKRIILIYFNFSLKDPILTIVATTTVRDIFQTTEFTRKRVPLIKELFSSQTNSDHIAVINIYNSFKNSRNYQNNFCRENLLSSQNLNIISKTKGNFFGFEFFILND